MGNSVSSISQVLYSFPSVHSAMQLKFAIDLIVSYWSVSVRFSCDSKNMALSMNLI